jgi:hypothetical protein
VQVSRVVCSSCKLLNMIGALDDNKNLMVEVCHVGCFLACCMHNPYILELKFIAMYLLQVKFLFLYTQMKEMAIIRVKRKTSRKHIINSLPSVHFQNRVILSYNMRLPFSMSIAQYAYICTNTEFGSIL